MSSSNKPIRIVDTSQRDGSHAVKHQFTLEDIRSISSALDEAGVYGIEISHGDGLAGSSIQYERIRMMTKMMARVVTGVLNLGCR